MRHDQALPHNAFRREAFHRLSSPSLSEHGESNVAMSVFDGGPQEVVAALYLMEVRWSDGDQETTAHVQCGGERRGLGPVAAW